MIKVIKGVYGFMDKNGMVRPKTAADEPFELLPEQEARLVELGVAQYVEDVKNEQTDGKTAEDSANADGTDKIVDLENLSGKELREIGKKYGLTFKSNAKKVDMVKAITDAQAETAEDEDGEPAPVFDASEAVQ